MNSILETKKLVDGDFNLNFSFKHDDISFQNKIGLKIKLELVPFVKDKQSFERSYLEVTLKNKLNKTIVTIEVYNDINNNKSMSIHKNFQKVFYQKDIMPFEICLATEKYLVGFDENCEIGYRYQEREII